ncbi:MAG: cation:proton antiporter [Ignavibacteriae bacterium]|nr:cation:proton antiporter [Ignavibacteriota bacterium]
MVSDFIRKPRWSIFLTILILPFSSCTGNFFAPSHLAITFFWIVLLLVGARLSGVIERWKQPAVLGELLLGVLLGNVFLTGYTGLESLRTDATIHFLAELGVVILLFQVGLESDIQAMRRVGIRAFLVASIGVIVPFILGTWIAGPLLLPGLTFNSYLFIGAIFTATSVGITARVFKDAKAIHTIEAQIVLGAAVIDDIMGLIILAVVSAMVTTNSVDITVIGIIMLKAFGFLAIGILIRQFAAERISKFMSNLSGGIAMKFTFAIATGLFFAFLADSIGLAAIVGAFTAGIILDPVHFRHFDNPKIVTEMQTVLKNASIQAQHEAGLVLERYADHHVDSIIAPIGYFLSPIFFVMTGFAVNIQLLGNIHVVLVALGLTVVAVGGKVVAGLAAGKVRKIVVGFGMVPRGEVGLIFAAMGRQLNVINSEEFSIIVLIVILTTLITPPILSKLLRINVAG